MNKAMVDMYIPNAYDAIKTTKIEKNGKVKKTYRGQISSLGAAITMGSVKSAVCYFNKKANNDSDIDRSELLKAIKHVLDKDPVNGKDTQYAEKKDLWECVIDPNFHNVQEDIINAAIAIKLALNLFEWEE